MTSEIKNRKPFFVVKLNKFIEGKISKEEFLDGEEYIDEINDNNLIINFEDSDNFFKFLGFKETLNIINSIIYPYWGHLELIVDDTMHEDWDEGYLISRLSEENVSTINNILKILRYDVESMSDKQIAKAFETNFENIVSDIKNEFYVLFTNAKEESIKDYIESRVDEILGENYIEVKKYKEYSIDSKLLLSILLGNSNLTFYHFTPKILINAENDDEDENLMQEVYDYNYEINDSTYENFDKAITAILDNIDIFSKDFDRFFEFIKRIPSKYKLKTWYTVPKNNNLEFKIYKFNFDENLIEYFVRETDNEQSKQKFSKPVNLFLNFLYQPELF